MPKQIRKFGLRRGVRSLGPGLITGAADDDPSGIATYSQAGAQFGYSMLWTMVFTLPLMAAIQLVSARIGYVTGRGLASNIKARYPQPVVLGVVGLLLAANLLNIAADIAAMAEALRLVLGGPAQVYAVTFGLLCLLLQVFVSYARYVRWLKWLTLALLSYVAVAFTLNVDVADVLHQLVWPRLAAGPRGAADGGGGLRHHDQPLPVLLAGRAGGRGCPRRPRPPAQRAEVRRHLRQIKWDTVIGMSFSNLIAFFIILSTGATLHAAGMTDIQTSAQAAEALRPLAGRLTFLLFSLGIIGTGLLAVPVLAGSAAYAVAEAAGWQGSLTLRLDKGEGHGFYGVVATATLGGVGLGFLPIDPVRELFWSAVLNGVIAVPIMTVMMLLASQRRTMGEHVIGPRLRWLGWAATAVMAAVVVATIVTA